MIIYQFTTDFEKAHICHRNTARRWIKEGKVEEARNIKGKLL